MARGDHIRVRRQNYWHHGIDCGDGTVIHYAGLAREKVDACVCRTTLVDFTHGAAIEIVQHSGCYTADEIVRRAESRLGETRYALLTNNCEHFAAWCACGRRRSRQVGRAVAMAGTVVIAAAGVLTVAGVRMLRRGA